VERKDFIKMVSGDDLTIDKDKAMELLYGLKSFFHGVFSASFIKKDLKVREILARFRVKKHLKGGVQKYNPKDFKQVTVFDMQNYKLKIETLEILKEKLEKLFPGKVLHTISFMLRTNWSKVKKLRPELIEFRKERDILKKTGYRNISIDTLQSLKINKVNFNIVEVSNGII